MVGLRLYPIPKSIPQEYKHTENNHMRPTEQLRHLGKSERIVLLILLLLGALLVLASLRSASSSLSSTTPSSSPQPNSIMEGHSDSLYTSPAYVGPPERNGYTAVKKFPSKQILDLNRIDSLTLLRIPGIGPTFAKRILSLRQRLGGYYTILQLQEVYGMNEDKFLELRSWFRIHTLPHQYRLSELQADSLPNHPYLMYRHKRALRRLISRYGQLHSWRTLMRTQEFTHDDSIRLSPYFIESKQLDSLVVTQTTEP